MVRSVLVIGGGIGGLTFGQALKRSRIPFRIYEQAHELKGTVGGGIGLWRNSQWVLDELQLLHHLKQYGSWMKFPGYREPSGRYLARPTPHFSERFPVLCLHRADLQRTLLQGIEDHVVTGKKLLHFTQDSNSVTAHFEDGTSASGDLLVGCDGIHSLVRNQLYSSSSEKILAHEKYCGYAYFRATLDVSEKEFSAWEGSFETWGKGMRFGNVPLKAPQVFWFASIPLPSLAASGGYASHPDLLSLFQSWHDPIPALIQKTPSSSVFRTDIYKIPALARWVSNRVALLGDACHATAPNLAQGAGLAIEDALQLAKAIQLYNSRSNTTISLEQSLKQNYQSIRIPRAKTVQSLADTVALIGQISSSVFIVLRNWTMLLTPTLLKSFIFELLVRVSLGWNYLPPILIQEHTNTFWKRVFGSDTFARLPQHIQAFRQSATGGKGRGWSRVTLGSNNNFVYRLLGKLLLLPPPNPRAEFVASVRVEDSGAKQIWTRIFDGHPFSTEMTLHRNNHLLFLKERIGPLAFLYSIQVDARSVIHYQSHGALIFGVPLPSFLQPRSSWEEEALPNGWKFKGRISLPLIGTLFSYEGEFQIEN